MPRKAFLRSAAVVILTSLALCLAAASALAKGTFARITISGGQLPAARVVTDPALLGFGSLGAFPTALSQPPIVQGDGYSITRYYPNAAGSGGYIYYEGLVNGSSDYDRHWFQAVPAGDQALRRILAAPESSAAAAPGYMPLLVLAFAIIAALALAAQSHLSGRAPAAG